MDQARHPAEGWSPMSDTPRAPSLRDAPPLPLAVHVAARHRPVPAQRPDRLGHRARPPQLATRRPSMPPMPAGDPWAVGRQPLPLSAAQIRRHRRPPATRPAVQRSAGSRHRARAAGAAGRGPGGRGASAWTSRRPPWTTPGAAIATCRTSLSNGRRAKDCDSFVGPVRPGYRRHGLDPAALVVRTLLNGAASGRATRWRT